MAQNTQTFILVGDFKDNITPALKKLTKSLKTFEKSFSKSFSKPMASINKDWAKLEKDMMKGMNSFDKKFQQATRKMAQNSKKDFKAIGDSFEEAVFSEKAMRRSLARFDKYQREVQRRARRNIRGGEILYDAFTTENLRDQGRGGRGGRGGSAAQQLIHNEISDGFSIEKGVIAGLAVEGVTRIMDMLVNSVGGAINYLKGAIKERIEDEMSDIKSAGGMFSVGKENKIPFADTFDEAMGLQKKLNAEMANLAAALPGTTNDYVRNMKMVTDTSMKAVASDTQGMIKELNELKKAGVVAQDTVIKTQQEAFVETTKQMAKFSTLAEQGQSGGMPFTSLMEQMITSDKVDVKSLKSRYAALRYDPLISGAIESFQAEMNKYGAGTAQRTATMLKALNKAFPPEVIAAMEKSADGIYQAMKSYLFDPDVGWFGLGRLMEIDFSEFKANKMGNLKETMGLFDMFVKMFGAFGQILGPILKELPKIMEVFSSVIDPFKEFYVNAENTISNFNKAKKDFAKAKKSFPEFRASLKAIGQLAQSFGGDKAEIGKLNQLINADKLDLGQALQQAAKTLFSSEAMERFGKAVGQALGSFISMLAGLAETGKSLVDESGLMKGFAEGWKKTKGSEAIAKLIRDLIGFIVKTVAGLIVEAAKTDPIGVGLVATIFISPIRAAVINFLKGTAGQIIGGLGGGGGVTRAGARITTSGGRAAGGGVMGGIGRALLGNFQAGEALVPAGARGAIRGGANAMKAKAMGPLAAGIVTMATKAPALAKAGQALVQFGKKIPLLSVAFTAADFGMRVAGGEKVTKAAGGALGGLSGGMLGAAIGTALAGPVGTVIGGVIGTVAGDKLGTALGGLFVTETEKQNQAAAIQLQAAQKQLQASNEKMRQLGLGPLGGATSSVEDPMKLHATIQMLGLAGDKQVIEYENTVSKLRGLRDAAQVSKDSLYTLVNSLKGKGFNPEEIWKQDDVRALSARYQELNKKVAAEQANVQKKFGELPQNITRAITTSLQTMDTKAIEYAIANRIQMMPGQNMGYTIPGLPGGPQRMPGNQASFKPQASTNPFLQNLKWSKAKGEPGVAFGSLGQAVNYEMKNKPAGSDLVIANSSETIIPKGKVGTAAGGAAGEGMMALVNAIFTTAAATRSELARGFTDLTRVTLAGDSKIVSTTQQGSARTAGAINRQIATQIAGDAKILGAIKAASAAGGFGGGGPLGGASGSLQAADAMAKSMGLTMTSYKRSGPPGASYHNVGRAMDFSNSTGPTPQMMQFAQAMAAKYGSSMAELIYTPLGYGIKNGKKVAPYAAAAHYNHVHVAFAKGPGNPTAFSSKGAAIAYEKFMAPAGAKVASVTSNSSELGGTTNLTQNITIDGYGGNPEQLAAVVWDYTQKAIGRMQSNSFA